MLVLWVYVHCGCCSSVQHVTALRRLHMPQLYSVLTPLRIVFYRHSQQDTILLSCGVADLIATCYLGRNSRCGAAFAKNLLHELESSSSSSDSDHNEGIAVKPLWAKAVQKVCSGQHPPGISTSSQVYKCLLHRYGDSKERVFERYPLFTRIYEVAREGKTPERMFKWKQL
jgi:glycerol-3-phosphate dehydrogenase (NAD+)